MNIVEFLTLEFILNYNQIYLEIYSDSQRDYPYHKLVIFFYRCNILFTHIFKYFKYERILMSYGVESSPTRGESWRCFNALIFFVNAENMVVKIANSVSGSEC